MEWWLYFLRELVTFEDIPNQFQGDIIEGAFNLAKLANMSYEDRHTYELSLKYYRDFINVMDTAKKDAREEAEMNMAIKMKAKGYDLTEIMELTGLTLEIIERL